MQNAHIHLDIHKALSPARRFSEVARRWVSASVLKPANYHARITPPPTLQTISVIFHKAVLTIVSVGLPLLCLLARCLSVASWAFFVVVSGFSRCMLSMPIVFSPIPYIFIIGDGSPVTTQRYRVRQKRPVTENNNRA